MPPKNRIARAESCWSADRRGASNTRIQQLGDPAQSAADGSDARLPELMAPSDLTSKLPELPGQGPAKAPSELGSATELTQGQRPQRNLGGGGKAQTSVFGVTGTGFSIRLRV